MVHQSDFDPNFQKTFKFNINSGLHQAIKHEKHKRNTVLEYQNKEMAYNTGCAGLLLKTESLDIK